MVLIGFSRQYIKNMDVVEEEQNEKVYLLQIIDKYFSLVK